jgi:serine/threonine-protein kinase
VPCLLDVLRDESEYVRRAAVEVLNQVATTEAIQDLVRAMRDEDWWVRVRAADALGTLGGEKVVDAVCHLLSDPDDFVRRYAVEVLNSVPSQRAVGPLIGALDDQDWWVRERSIDALGRTRDPRAIEPLVDLLKRDSSLASLCARALASIGDRQSIETLCALAHSDRQDVRLAAGEVLAHVPPAGLDPEIRALMKQALGQENPASPSGIPLRVESRRSGFGPEAGREPLPAVGSRTPVPGHPGDDHLQPTTTPLELTLAQTPTASGPDGEVPGVGGGNLLDRPEGEPVHRTRTINFYELIPETTLLNRYRVLRTIGKGGFGVVYLVHDSAIRDETILKVLNPQLSTDELAIMRFVRELKLTRKITHKNVIRIHDLLDLGGAMAVSMEYFPGQDLGKILQQEGRLGIDRALVILEQVCEGLSAAHAAGVIHRDIKPANILVGKDDTVKIVDFGLASARQQMGSRLTKSGLLVGTPEYMAPEQITDGTVDPRTDVYSVGILMYEILAGRQPYRGETAVQILFQHLESTAAPLSDSRPDISPELEALVARAMAREPLNRHPSAEDLRQDIQTVRSSTAARAADA